jgi:hypothetical protein
MAWCLGVIYERGTVEPDLGVLVEVSDLNLLKAFNSLVKGSELVKDKRWVAFESVHVAERLVELGMEKCAFRASEVPPIPDTYTRYVIRGILDTHGSIASFGPYLAEIKLEFPTYNEACLEFIRRELKRRGYHNRAEPREIDFLGVSSREPASYVWALSMSRPGEIIDCYKWLYGKPDSRVKFYKAQKWVWSQLQWMLRDLEACAEMLKDKEMVSELQGVVKEGMRMKLMGDWSE